MRPVLVDQRAADGTGNAPRPPGINIIRRRKFGGNRRYRKAEHFSLWQTQSAIRCEAKALTGIRDGIAGYRRLPVPLERYDFIRQDGDSVRRDHFADCFDGGRLLHHLAALSEIEPHRGHFNESLSMFRRDRNARQSATLHGLGTIL
jgi:hypothetical protein